MPSKPLSDGAPTPGTGIVFWAIGSAVLYVVCSMVFQQYFCSIVGFAFLGLLLAALRPRAGFRKLLICTVGFFVSVSAVYGNNALAYRRAEEIVAAVQAFESTNDRYPDSLPELVPEYLPDVPRPNYSITFNSFHYRSSSAGAFLTWTETPPFGRPGYDFRSARWTYVD